MTVAAQIIRAMSLRAPQAEALAAFDAISAPLDYKTASLESVRTLASEQSRATKPITFDTEFPSFCFALATGVGKTRLMGASIAYLWKTKGYRNFFILAPNITIYDKLRAELNFAHPKYMFVGLSDFPRPAVFDGDNYLRYRPGQAALFGEATVFIFNISKIFKRGDQEFRFHTYQEELGNAFSAMLRGMDDLVILMDESHRYRAPASLAAINHLRPVVGLEFTATPKTDANVVYSFSLAQAVGKFIKTPTVVTRTNLTTSDAAEIERIKLIDGMTIHEGKKARLLEYCQANNLPPVKPFVLISTKDTAHAREVRALIESPGFCEGRYQGKVLEIHSATAGAETDENIKRLLEVESPSSTVEVVVHVNMLKEGWDVKNLYTIIPLRASVSEILTEQTVGRGLRMPFVELTGDAELDTLEIVSHDNYAKLIEAAKTNQLFHIKVLDDTDLQPRKTVTIHPRFIDSVRILERMRDLGVSLFASTYTREEQIEQVVTRLVAEEAAAYETRRARPESGPTAPGSVQPELFTKPADTVPEAFDPIHAAAAYREGLRTYARYAIDVPAIYLDTVPSRQLEPFAVQVTVGPFTLVEQRLKEHELTTGTERLGEAVKVIEIREPDKFLAGRLLDAVDELAAEEDKETALALAREYIGKMNVPEAELGRIIHLYRDAVVNDLKNQVEAHLHEENRVEVSIGREPIRWPTDLSKTVYQQEGILPYSAEVPGSRIRGYLFEGFAKTLYPLVAFDSVPEKAFAALLERDPAVVKWVRPPLGCLRLYHRGSPYTPDFIVQTADRKYLVEIKDRNEVTDDVVREKAAVAIRWCAEASKVSGEPQWEYKLVSDNSVTPTADMQFVLGQAVKV